MRSKIMLALCLLLLFLTACQKQTSDDPIVASYKETQIHESLVAYEKQNQINVIMLDEAEQRGLSVTQEEVDAELAGQRKNYEEYEEVRSYIDDYCTKMGITTEQYFDTVAEQLPRRMLRQRLRDTLGQEYCQQHGLEFTKVNPPEQMTGYVEQYLDGLLQAHRSEIKYYEERKGGRCETLFPQKLHVCRAVSCVQPSRGRLVRPHVVPARPVRRQRDGGRSLARVEDRARDAGLPLR